MVKKKISKVAEEQEDHPSESLANTKIRRGQPLLQKGKLRAGGKEGGGREGKREKLVPLLRVKKGRSSSVGGLGKDKMPEIFHFPDTHLLRSLISKRLIE